MKKIQVLVISLFFIIVLLPIVCFNFTPNSISLIDNRKLADNPFVTEGDITVNIESYVNDRIGFRDEMILAYTVLNDIVFEKMVHPSYSYGKDGYVFGAGLTTSNYFGDFHIVFADMVKEIQDYCEEREVPFLFVFNPAKPALYEDKIAAGINYNREWVDLFLAELDKRGINYLDNTNTLIHLQKSGKHGFNQKYDANHWNDMGAFYGTQKMLECLKEDCPSIHVNEISEFIVSEEHKDSLLVSNFPIDEVVPRFELDVEYSDLYSDYSEINLHPSYMGFGYYVNETRKSEGCPKALVFQGSYMNSYGYKYMINSFAEYIHVHDYQNVIDFPYYFNIFLPDCVIFEVAEYTLYDSYFNLEAMKAIDYNPSIESLSESAYSQVDISNQEIIVDKGKTLTNIIWNTTENYEHVWLELDCVYDMKVVDGGYQTTIETTRVGNENDIKLFVTNENDLE